MSDRPRRPVRLPGWRLDRAEGELDPAVQLRIAHDSARALVRRLRDGDDDLVERMVAYTDEHGLATLAELWSVAGPRSLPGTLWRLSLLRAMIRESSAGAALMFRRGVDALATADEVVAGAAEPAGPDEMLRLADDVLHGAYAGDFAVALDRAAAFCRVCSAGAAALADAADGAGDDATAAEFTARAARLDDSAREFTASARLERKGSLD